MATFKSANPDNSGNQLALEITRMQLEMAQQLAQEAGVGDKLLPALVIALALNRHARETAPKA